MDDCQYLRNSPDINLAAVDLDYESFRALAQNPHLSMHERIGFPNSYREGFEREILADIVRKLPMLTEAKQLTVVDIGPGCASLPRLLIALCGEQRHRVVLVDSQEMLTQLPDIDGVTSKIVGRFPTNLQDILEACCGGGADAVLCYSVLHYLYAESNIFAVIDAVSMLLAPGGYALFGDIPNSSKRHRFFASAAGKAFHRKFTGVDSDPDLSCGQSKKGKIDDAVLAACIARAQDAGCDAYLLPQDSSLPMANRRDDLLIRKP
jgi:2-polyprenyl-3-methyl-5-hydroxy-6-metoxy-1,4-benzoquinol methylase